MNLTELLTAELSDCTVSESLGEITCDVPAAGWVQALTVAREALGCRFFDWLTAVDEGGDGFSVVCHLWSVERRYGLLLRTRVPLDDPHLSTVTGIFAGAGWHERETYEMFGIVFDGHPHLVPLLLPEGFEGHPLRKEFVLASRVAKEWPGAREPGESSAAGPARRRMRPPGVPDPADWGPNAVAKPPAGEPAPLTDAGTAASPSGSTDPPVPPTATDHDPGKPGPAGAGPTLPGSPEGWPAGRSEEEP